MRHAHFTTAVLAHKDRIYSQAYYFLGNRPDAEDVTQEVLLRAWQNLDAIRKPTVKAWLMRVTHNLCIDTLRRHKAQQVVRTPEASDGCEMGLPLVAEDDPQVNAEESELRRHLLQAIQRLPVRLRSVIIMRELQDMTYEEISSALDLPLNSVKVYIHRGRKLLRAALGHLLEEVD
ncbi:MAG: sigma-70 family RNA polymerase sigma factor [candidate division KSB1 bacterium]|nr:sigma-70 family RNA polymerase sigma factor [candidate division KSB1 bacterium]